MRVTSTLSIVSREGRFGLISEYEVRTGDLTLWEFKRREI
jgi:hypothetical protein